MEHPYSPLRRLYLLLAVLAFVLLFSHAAEAQSAERLHRFVISDTPAAAQCNEAKEVGWLWWDIDEDTDGSLFVCTGAGGWKAVGGGGGSGDITDVWTATSGNVNALTAAAGDSLDCGAADSCSPAPRSTTLPATCTEGFFYQDTDSTGSEVYACTAANTWVKFLAAADIDTSAKLRGVLSDENGTGAALFDGATSPNFTTTVQVGGADACLEDGTNCPEAIGSLVFGASSTTHSNSATTFLTVSGVLAAGANDTPVQHRPGSDVTFSYLRCAVLTAAPGSGKSWAITLRVGGSDTALSVTITDTNLTSGVDTDSVSVAGDSSASTRLAYAVVPTGTPTASAIGCSMAMLAQ